jgi:hypothetical protein
MQNEKIFILDIQTSVIRGLLDVHEERRILSRGATWTDKEIPECLKDRYFHLFVFSIPF